MPLAARLLVLLAGLSLTAASPAAGQELPDSTDATGPGPFSYGRSVTYPDILAETIRLRLSPQAPSDTLRPADPFIGIQGLVVDETATPPGRLFYETFFLLWAPPPGAERTSVTLSEQPLLGNGTAIVVRADGEVLLQARLPRRPDEVEDLAGQAVQFVRQRLAGG